MTSVAREIGAAVARARFKLAMDPLSDALLKNFKGKVWLDPTRSNLESQFNPHANQVRVPASPNPAVLAHEMGHHDFHGTLLGKATQSLPGLVASRVLGVPLSAALGGIGAASDSKWVPWATGALGGALAAAPLISEVGASLRGYNLLKNVKASPEALSAARRTMLLAGSTYLPHSALMASLSVGMPWLIRRRRRMQQLAAQASDKGVKTGAATAPTSWADPASTRGRNALRRAGQAALIGGAVSAPATLLALPALVKRLGDRLPVSPSTAWLAGIPSMAMAGGLFGALEGGRRRPAAAVSDRTPQ